MAMATKTTWKNSLKALVNAKIPVAVELRKLQQITKAVATSTAWKKSLKALVATYWSHRRYSSMMPLVADAQVKRVEAKTRASFQLVRAGIVAAKRWAKLEPQRMIVVKRTMCRWVSVRRIRIAEVHARRRQIMKIVATIPGLIQLRQQELLKRQEERVLVVQEIHDQIQQEPMAIDMQHTQGLSRATNAFHHAIVSKTTAISARYRELVEPIDLPPQSLSLDRMPSSNEAPERNRMPVAALSASS
ncbi:hypothetical protein AC1031_012634 [Aphanomyces cochlioides]|nr:hypothetical protein AC1031_012634 [Aphanomyces cochlioides]